MDWALFCQIEVMLLTLGLVISFTITWFYGAKDNSFFKRMTAIGKVIEDYFKNKEQYNIRNQTTDRYREFLELMKKRGTEK